MDVSNKVIEEYYNSSRKKYLQVYFPNLDLTFTNSEIYSESFELKENLVSGTNFEFVGCVSNQMSVIISDTTHDLKGQRVLVSVYTENTSDEPVKLFNGYVKSAELQSNKKFKKITAYDVLSDWVDSDCTEWYNDLQFPMTIKEFRNAFFLNSYLSQEQTNLPNDNIIIPSKIELSGLNRLALAKNICQINGVFGVINREGKFEYRVLKSGEEHDKGLFPPFFPGNNAFPGVAASSRMAVVSTKDNSIGYYKSVNYSEYVVNPVDKIVISKGTNEEEISYGDGENIYTIKGNFFTKAASTEDMQQMAQNIYDNIANVEFIPFNAQNVGMPFIECGLDSVSYMVTDFRTGQKTTKKFLVLGRTLSGIQALKDTYEAKGDEYQHTFVTEIKAYDDVVTQANVTSIVNTSIQTVLPEYTYTKQEFPTEVMNVVNQNPVFEVVNTLPPVQKPNTIYFVKK